MSITKRALAIARIQVGQGSADDKARVIAWDRLYAMLANLDSKTSVLLRFNAIVVAALAYMLIVSSTDPFLGRNATVKLVGTIIGHGSLLASVVSCGFAFPVINVQWDFFGMRLDRADRRGVLLSTMPPWPAWAISSPIARVSIRGRGGLAVVGGIGFAILVGIGTLH
jgi:hypothetical protein